MKVEIRPEDQQLSGDELSGNRLLRDDTRFASGKIVVFQRGTIISMLIPIFCSVPKEWELSKQTTQLSWFCDRVVFEIREKLN